MLTEYETRILQGGREMKENVQHSNVSPISQRATGKTSSTKRLQPGALALPTGHSSLPGFARSVVADREASSPRLTPRQLEVLALLCEGYSNKLIARRLEISSGTVKIHIGCILQELNASNRLQAVVVAYRWGVVGGSPDTLGEAQAVPLPHGADRGSRTRRMVAYADRTAKRYTLRAA